jgi:hypothetical protein
MDSFLRLKQKKFQTASLTLGLFGTTATLRVLQGEPSINSIYGLEPFSKKQMAGLLRNGRFLSPPSRGLCRGLSAVGIALS